MFDLADSCLVLHGRSSFKVCLLALFRQQLKTAHFDPDGIYVPFFLFRFNCYMYPLQLLWNQSSVYRHGSNSISLYSCDSLLLPN